MRFSPSCGCCFPEECNACAGTCFPSSLFVSFSSIADGSCTDCELLNENFEVQFNAGESAGNLCVWTLTTDIDPCGGTDYATIRVEINAGVTPRIRVFLDIPGYSLGIWSEDSETQYNCGSLYNHSVPAIFFVSTPCDTQTADVLVTAGECFDRGCVASLTEPPANFNITLDLFGDDVACGDCSTLNTTWSVAYSGSSTPGACSWVSSTFTLCSTLTDLYIELTATAGVGSYTVTVTVRDATTIYAQWSETQATPFDMASWSAAALSFDSTTLACLFFFGDPTCTATAV